MTHHPALDTPRTLWEFIERAIARYADAPALALRDSEPEIRWTYRELGRRIETAAEQLAARGIGRGDRVLIWGTNRPQWGAAFFALFRLGAVVVPLDYRSAPDFVRRIAERTRAKALLVDCELSESFPLEVGPRILIDDLWEPAELPASPSPEGEADDVVEIVFTSGTTGEPKGVMITNRNLLANVVAMDRVIHLHPGWRLVSLLPLSHLFEQTVGLMDVLGSGACTVYLHHQHGRPASWRPSTRSTPRPCWWCRRCSTCSCRASSARCDGPASSGSGSYCTPWRGGCRSDCAATCSARSTGSSAGDSSSS